MITLYDVAIILTISSVICILGLGFWVYVIHEKSKEIENREYDDGIVK